MSTDAQQASEATHGVQDPNDPQFKYTCFYPECTFTSKERSFFNVHLAAHTGDKVFRCVICEKTYSVAHTLVKHQKHVHGQIVFVDSKGRSTKKRWASPVEHPLMMAYLDMGRKLWDLLMQDRLHVEVKDESFIVDKQNEITIVTWRDPVVSSAVPQNPALPIVPVSAKSPCVQVNDPDIASTSDATLQAKAGGDDATMSTNNAAQDTMLCDTDGEYGNANGEALRPLMPQPAVAAAPTQLGPLTQQQVQEKQAQLALALQLPGQSQLLQQRLQRRRHGHTEVRKDPYPRLDVGGTSESNFAGAPSGAMDTQDAILKRRLCVSNIQKRLSTNETVANSADIPAASGIAASTHIAGHANYDMTNTNRIHTDNPIPVAAAAMFNPNNVANMHEMGIINNGVLNTTNLNFAPLIGYSHPYLFHSVLEETHKGNIAHQVPVDQGSIANMNMRYNPNGACIPPFPANGNNASLSDNGVVRAALTNEEIGSFIDMELEGIEDGMDFEEFEKDFLYPNSHGYPPAGSSSSGV
ncbi:hypothetical protein AX16_001679 [Volvariella volvacea WC 439]|nr:hypothetical protein AX16_001679 [Volvariella volvacea WC 439]